MLPHILGGTMDIETIYIILGVIFGYAFGYFTALVQHFFLEKEDA